jgi:hypothetical protein
VRKNYQRKARKSNHKFEVVGGQELLVRVPLPMAEVWAELQAQVEELAGQAGLQNPAGHSGKRSQPPGRTCRSPKARSTLESTRYGGAS